ncbi:MAG: hypothetical protein OXT67_10365 [Zetaproteobacteria bacterium]|nr:hypothetical protein [Zetaproteobacteria bacterium]
MYGTRVHLNQLFVGCIIAVLVLHGCRQQLSSSASQRSDMGDMVRCELPETSAVGLNKGFRGAKTSADTEVAYRIVVRNANGDAPVLDMESIDGGIRPSIGLRAQHHQYSVDYSATINLGYSENYELYLPDDKSGLRVIYTQIFHSEEGDHFYSSSGNCTFINAAPDVPRVERLNP